MTSASRMTDGLEIELMKTKRKLKDMEQRLQKAEGRANSYLRELERTEHLLQKSENRANDYLKKLKYTQQKLREAEKKNVVYEVHTIEIHSIDLEDQDSSLRQELEEVCRRAQRQPNRMNNLLCKS